MRYSRSIIALVAAYAIALQALLAGWVVVTHAAAAASLGVICTHDGGTGGGAVPGHGSDCLCGPACTMVGHAASLALPDAPLTAIAWTPGKGEVIAAADLGRGSIPASKTRPQLPRAPPTA